MSLRQPTAVGVILPVPLVCPGFPASAWLFWVYPLRWLPLSLRVGPAVRVHAALEFAPALAWRWAAARQRQLLSQRPPALACLLASPSRSVAALRPYPVPLPWLVVWAGDLRSVPVGRRSTVPAGQLRRSPVEEGPQKRAATTDRDGGRVIGVAALNEPLSWKMTTRRTGSPRVGYLSTFSPLTRPARCGGLPFGNFDDVYSAFVFWAFLGGTMLDGSGFMQVFCPHNGPSMH